MLDLTPGTLELQTKTVHQELMKYMRHCAVGQHLVMFFLLVVLTLESYPAPTWKGITPLVSTRADVERVLNASDPTMDVVSTYFSKWGKLYVQYSEGKCADSKENEWDVVKDTVLGPSIYPKEPLFPADLGFDLSKFIRESVAIDLPSMFVFRNMDDGLAYYVDENSYPKPGIVPSYSYFPAKTDDHLQCR